MQNTAHPGGSIVKGSSGQAGHPTTLPVRERVRPPEKSQVVGSTKSELVNIESLQVRHKSDDTVYVIEGSICSLCHNLCHCDKVLNYPLYERGRLSKGSTSSRMIDHRTLVIKPEVKNELHQGESFVNLNPENGLKGFTNKEPYFVQDVVVPHEARPPEISTAEMDFHRCESFVDQNTDCDITMFLNKEHMCGYGLDGASHKARPPDNG